MTEKSYSEFVCPQCHGPLSTHDDFLKCSKCAIRFPVVFEIPCFTSGESAWSFPQSESIDEIIGTARTYGWEVSLSKIDSGKADWIRGTGRFTISVLASPKERVLDAGCGWGGLSFWMAKEFGHVYALDSQLNGLQFINVRASQERFNNITTVQGSVFSLPFPDGFFDVVVVNGVLEWVGTFSEDHAPAVMQQMALNEIARVIQPNGTMFLAIENRFGIQYFLGHKEEHTGLRYISLLPRRLAQIYHRHLKDKDFRALTHSRPGLMKILERSGFQHSVWFSVFPSYRNCRYAASLEGTGAMKFILRNFGTDKIPLPHVLSKIVVMTLYKSSFLLKIASFFSPSWLVFASFKKTPQLGLHSTNDVILIRDSENVALAVVINNRRANILRTDSSSGRLLDKYSLPINEGAKKKIRMSTSCVKLIRRWRPSLNDNLPKISIYLTRYGLFEYTEAISGVPLNLSDHKGLSLFFDSVVSLSRLSVPENQMQGIPHEFDIRDRLSALATKQGLTGRIQDELKNAQIIHGDLNKGNILLSTKAPRRAIFIDFEHAKIGPAVLNWYDFLLRNLVIYGGRYPIKTDVVLQRCQKLPGNEEADPFLSKLTAKFLNCCRVPLDLHGHLTILYMSYLCQDPLVANQNAIFRTLASMDFRV